MAGSSLWPDAVDNLKENYADGAVGGDIVAADNQNNPNASINAIQDEIVRTYRPDLKPVTPSAYDDEFETGALDPMWTAFNCATGTVDLLSTAAAKDTWDATMYTGMMALQPGRDDNGAGGPEAQAAILRQTVALAANCKVIAKVSLSTCVDLAEAGQPGQVGILLSGVTGFNDNNYAEIRVTPFWDVGTPILGYDIEGAVKVGGAATSLTLTAAPPSNGIYLMIMKTGNDYSIWTGDGRSWGPGVDGSAPDVIRVTNANALTRLSIFCTWEPAAAEVNLPNPIAVFDYVRYFTNNTPLTNA